MLINGACTKRMDSDSVWLATLFRHFSIHSEKSVCSSSVYIQLHTNGSRTQNGEKGSKVKWEEIVAKNWQDGDNGRIPLKGKVGLM